MTAMDKDAYKRLMQIAAQSIPKPTTYPPHAAVSFEPMFFRFSNLALNYGQFALPPRGLQSNRKIKLYDSLIAVFEILRELSIADARKIESEEGSSYSRCHYVHIRKKERLVELGLDVIEEVSGQNLFQLGINDDRERIMGFFSKGDLPFFEVCILDLNHNAYS